MPYAEVTKGTSDNYTGVFRIVKTHANGSVVLQTKKGFRTYRVGEFRIDPLCACENHTHFGEGHIDHEFLDGFAIVNAMYVGGICGKCATTHYQDYVL